MREVFAIWVIIVLLFLFFFSVFSLAESGYSNLLIAGLSGYCLFRILRHMYKGSHSRAAKNKRPSCFGSADEPPGPLELIIFFDATDEIDAEEWDD